ncbi:MAG: hypothetical protein Q8N53_08315 [Longimicrobiales bacterium]|nr:hypothetical protein [Longimicrobiales bacterium]
MTPGTPRALALSPSLTLAAALALASCVAVDSDPGADAGAVTGPPAESVAEAVWSADGRRLATTWTMGEHVRLMGVYGPAEGAPLEESTGLPLAHGNAGWASWSPDGLWVAYAGGEVGSRDIHRGRPDGTGPESLASDPADDFDPAYSPDGRSVVFVSTRTGGTAKLHVMDADGANARLLADLGGPVRRPMWSPDGRRLAVQVTEGGQETIYLVSADGSGWGRLGTGLLPAWFPDGQRVVYAEHDSIFWRPADGGLRQFLVAGGSAPRPSPDGRWLAFVRAEGDDASLYLKHLGSGNETRITP